MMMMMMMMTIIIIIHILVLGTLQLGKRTLGDSKEDYQAPRTFTDVRVRHLVI